MNATIPMLLVSAVATGFATQGAAQQTSQPKVGSRVPVDVSLQALGEMRQRAPGRAVGSGSVGFSVSPTAGRLLNPQDCLARCSGWSGSWSRPMRSGTPGL